MKVKYSILILLIFGTLIFFARKNNPGSQSNLQDINLDPALAPSSYIHPGYKEYRNVTYSFSLEYPEDIKTKEFDEGGGAMTVTFENIKTVDGFQIFIIPYADTKISNERLLMDVPSGVVKDMREVPFGNTGLNAITFESSNVALGETREVWFIYHSYLYELTTLKSKEEFLNSIIKTWKFIK